MLTLIKNRTVYLDDVEYTVVSGLPDLDTLLENKQTGERIKISNYQLVTKYLTGEFRTAAQHRHYLKEESARARGPARMDNMSVESKKETHRRIDYLVRLTREGIFSKPRADQVRAIEKVARDRNDSRVPHIATIYRWKRTYREAQNDVRALFARFDTQGGKGGCRLDPAVEELIDEQVNRIALKQRRFSAQDIQDGLRLAIQAANLERRDAKPLVLPSLRTVQRRLYMLAEYDLTVAQTSLVEANRRFALHGVSRAVCRLLEIVEIDHSPVDLMVVDANRKTVGRPTITVVLDRASRCVLGYHLSLAGHAVPAVFEALRHALLPKAYLTDRYADMKLQWECFGWPERVLMDNGREFHADAVADALLNLGIACEYAKSRTPNDKPFVERFLRTFNYGFIHKQKGTTLDKAHKRAGFRAEDDAVLTLEELDRTIHYWICNIYHLRPHRGLENRAPIDVWRELAKAHPPQLKMNAADIDIEFSEVAEPTLQRYGIDLNTFVYRSDRLLTIGRLLPAKSKTVFVKWPRNDVGHIWVWDKIAQEYFKVKNTKQEYAGLTLAQAKAARKAKSAGDPSYVQTAAETGAIIRQQSAESSQSKKLAQRRKGAKLDNTTSATAREPERFNHASDDDVDVSSIDSHDVEAHGDLEDIAVDLPIENEGV